MNFSCDVVKIVYSREIIGGKITAYFSRGESKVGTLFSSLPLLRPPTVELSARSEQPSLILLYFLSFS